MQQFFGQKYLFWRKWKILNISTLSIPIHTLNWHNLSLHVLGFTYSQYFTLYLWVVSAHVCSQLCPNLRDYNSRYALDPN